VLVFGATLPTFLKDRLHYPAPKNIIYDNRLRGDHAGTVGPIGWSLRKSTNAALDLAALGVRAGPRAPDKIVGLLKKLSTSTVCGAHRFFGRSVGFARARRSSGLGRSEKLAKGPAEKGMSGRSSRQTEGVAAGA